MVIHEMTMEECHEFLKHMKFGRLACSHNGQPYVVPIYFVSDGKHLYAFSTLGKKIEWMRTNPLVCVEADEVVDDLHWKSVIVLGRYEELEEIPEKINKRKYALALLQNRSMWWQPAFVTRTFQSPARSVELIYYRIRVEEVTGHRAVPDLPQTFPNSTVGP